MIGSQGSACSVKMRGMATDPRHQEPPTCPHCGGPAERTGQTRPKVIGTVTIREVEYRCADCSETFWADEPEDVP